MLLPAFPQELSKAASMAAFDARRIAPAKPALESA
jgi:hypothetical protein